MRHLFVAVALIAASVTVAGCSSGSATCDPPTATTTVDIQNSTFSPGCVSAATGQTLTLHNADDTAHTFTVKGTGVDVKLDGGQTGEASLAGVAAGTYAVSCLYHPEMTESLQVT
jgi:plastocyanin